MSYKEWTLTKIKDELRRRDAKVSGRKKDLVARLIFLDSCKSGEREEPEVEFLMDLPDSTCYKDIHTDMVSSLPSVTMSRLNEYLSQFDQSLDEKVKWFYKERFVRYIRMATENNRVLLTSNVWAEMRKAASYRVDISMTSEGVVLEAQCECGAGQGPNAHCKHVAAVIYGLLSIRKSGDIITELTCTQVLQTFHKTKTFKGSPVKIQKLQELRGRESHLVYDPRPDQWRGKIETTGRFQSDCINFAHYAEKPMSCLQLFPPANLPAMCHDHDYLKLTQEDRYLQDNMVSEITIERAEQLEIDTRGQNQNKLWMATRLNHLTSSNFGVICKAERRDLKKLAISFTETRDLRVPAILHGRKFEDVAVEAFEKKMGFKSEVCGIFVSTDNPQLASSPDRVLDSDTCLEIKCPFAARDKKVTPQTVPYLKIVNNELTLDNNHDYYYQVQGQLFCSKRKVCYLCLYTFQDLVTVKIYRDDIFINTMVDKLMTFYHSYFKAAVLNKFVYKNYYKYSFQY